MGSAKLFNTKEAGDKLGVSERRIRALCESGRLGTQVGSTWVITETEIRAFKPRPVGWPKGRKRKAPKKTV